VITSEHRPEAGHASWPAHLTLNQAVSIRKIKIDRSFVNKIAESEDSSPIVQAVISIAKARNMTTTAEGVEAEQQREMLHRLGCTEMQGYLLSPARPVAEIRMLLSRASSIAAA